MASSSYFLHLMKVVEQFFTAALMAAASVVASHTLTVSTLLLRLELVQQEHASVLLVGLLLIIFSRHSWAPALNWLTSPSHSEMKVMLGWGHLEGSQVLEQTGPTRCQGLIRGIATPALLCHKEPARRIQSTLLGALERKIPPLHWGGILFAPRWFFMAT